MPFAAYATVGDVARAYRVRWEKVPFVGSLDRPFGGAFREELEFTLREVPFDSSEAAACETLIYPILREVWKHYRAALTLWSHLTVTYDADLGGVVDYMITRRSPLGATVLDQPYLMVMEAKKDNFMGGWAQCLAAMLAAQKLNEAPDRPIFGITTNGRGWEFGRLTGETFAQEPQPFTLRALDDLAGALHYVMNECREQAGRPAPAAV